MSTRASIVFRDNFGTSYVYRHSDGYPETTGKDLKDFVKDYSKGALRLNVDQSMGWLIVRGHFEYKRDDRLQFDESDISGPKPSKEDKYSGWKVGAYEPTTSMHGDEEYIYIIDLEACTLECRVPSEGYWDSPCLEKTVPCKKMKTVNFSPKVKGA